MTLRLLRRPWPRSRSAPPFAAPAAAQTFEPPRAHRGALHAPAEPPDILARLIAPKLQEAVGQPVVV